MLCYATIYLSISPPFILQETSARERLVPLTTNDPPSEGWLRLSTASRGIELLVWQHRGPRQRHRFAWDTTNSLLGELVCLGLVLEHKVRGAIVYLPEDRQLLWPRTSQLTVL